MIIANLSVLEELESRVSGDAELGAQLLVDGAVNLGDVSLSLELLGKVIPGGDQLLAVTALSTIQDNTGSW